MAAISLNSSTQDDLPIISQWSKADIDPAHRTVPPEWWLTGNDCLLCFNVWDDQGIVFYARLEADRELVRVHIQFAPEEVVSRSRVAKALINSFPSAVIVGKQNGLKGIVFESKNPILAVFMTNLGFWPVEGTDDFVRMFDEDPKVVIPGDKVA